MKKSEEVIDAQAILAGEDVKRTRKTYEIVKASLKEFGHYTLENRALPRVFDGLKPSQRRILWALKELRALSNSVPIKCARVVGDCFVEGSLAHTALGIVPIENLGVLDKARLPDGTIAAISEFYQNPPSKVVTVVLSNGVELTVTPGQLFRTLTEDLTIRWKEAGQLLPNDMVLATHTAQLKTLCHGSESSEARKSYVAGLFAAEGYLHWRTRGRRVGITMTDQEPLKEVMAFCEDHGVLATWKKLPPKKKGYKTRYSIHFTGADPIYDICFDRCRTKKVPTSVLGDRKTFAPFIAGYLDGDGYLRKSRSSREIVFVSKSKTLLSQVQAILSDQGIQSSLKKEWSDYSTKETPKGSFSYYLRITGDQATELASWILPYLKISKKIKQAKRFASWKGRELNSASNCIPSKAIFDELTSRHLGGGWYLNSEGVKVRSRITYSNGTPITRDAKHRTGELSFRQIKSWGILEKLDQIGAGVLKKKIQQILDQYSILRVVKVQSRKKKQATYDIQVNHPDHAFLVQGCVVHNCMGKYHPHGDQSIYDTLVNMAFTRNPSVEAHGNFGWSKGLVEDPPAAMRYTETRLSKFGDRFFDDIEVMPLVKNYTEDFDEPPILPARVPIILANGCSGIALGLATDIPPHNLRDLIEACVYLVENPEAGSLDLAKILKGPDYGPNSGVLTSPKREIQALYVVGEGRLEYACTWHIEEGRRSNKLVITGKAPGLSLNKLKDTTIALADKKLLVAAINDESSMSEPTRLTIEFTDFNIVRDRILPLLHTKQSYRFFALDEDNKPRKYDLKGILEAFVDFRRAVEEKVLLHAKEQLEHKLGTEEARMAAIDNLDWVVDVLKTSKSVEDAISKLTKKLSLEVWQAEVILNSQVRSLMRLNAQTLEKRIADLKKSIAEVKKDLKQIDVVVVRRLNEMLAYADPRGMRIGKADTAEAMATQSSSYKYLAITAQGKVERFSDLPLKSKAAWNYVDLVSAQDPLLIVTDDNKGQLVSSSYLDQFTIGQGSKVIGLIPTAETQAVVVVSEDGQYVAFSPAVKKKRLQMFKSLPKFPLVRALALGKGDTLVVRWHDGSATELTTKDLRVGRANVTPRPLDRESDGLKVLGIWVRKKSQFLVDAKGNELGGEALPRKAKIWLAGKQNLVVLESGVRQLKDADQVLDLLEKNGKSVATIVVVPPPIKKPQSDPAA